MGNCVFFNSAPSALVGAPIVLLGFYRNCSCHFGWIATVFCYFSLYCLCCIFHSDSEKKFYDWIDWVWHFDGHPFRRHALTQSTLVRRQKIVRFGQPCAPLVLRIYATHFSTDFSGFPENLNLNAMAVSILFISIILILFLLSLHRYLNKIWTCERKIHNFHTKILSSYEKY